MRRHLESLRQAVGRCLTLVPIGWLLVTLGAGDAHAQRPSPGGSWQSYGTDNGEWRSYAGNTAGQKYSPLDQLDAGNFNQLEIAWEWTSVDRTLSRTTAAGGEWYAPLDTIVESLVADTPNLYREGQSPNPSRFQATPLMIDGVLYFNKQEFLRGTHVEQFDLVGRCLPFLVSLRGRHIKTQCRLFFLG